MWMADKFCRFLMRKTENIVHNCLITRRRKKMKNKEIKKRRAIKNAILYTVVGAALLSAIMSLYSLLRMAWSWKEFAVLMPVLLISVTILILFFYANDGFVDDYEIMMYYDEEDELDEDE